MVYIIQYEECAGKGELILFILRAIKIKYFPEPKYHQIDRSFEILYITEEKMDLFKLYFKYFVFDIFLGFFYDTDYNFKFIYQ